MSPIQCLLVLTALFGVGTSQLVSPDNIQFLLFDPNNGQTGVSVQSGNLTQIDTSAEVAILIHGWEDDADVSWYLQVRTAYLQKGVIVIEMDWSFYADNPIYAAVVLLVPSVGNVVADIIAQLNQALNVPLQSIGCKGHSLGAHICGFAGKSITQLLSGQKIGNIIGLDPAGPSYEGLPSSLRLDVGDATNVQAIHTNAGGEGIIESIGKTDFFPNGGSAQPNCLTSLNAECNHYASTLFFAESISSNKFVGRECSSYANYLLGALGGCSSNQTAVMGDNIDPSASGNYYLQTNPSSPYARG